jgi:DHA1 family bicyclomycin/chloramphenicol resistance-like MFS transporter
VGYLCIGVAVLAIVYVIEGGRLFHARETQAQS